MRPCPECGSENAQKVKSWDATPRGYPSQIRVIITIWECTRCHNRYRSAERTWKNESLDEYVIDSQSPDEKGSIL